MQKIKSLVVIALLVCGASLTKAQDSTIIRKGLIRDQLTLRPSYAFSEKQSSFYLHGTLEWYLSDRLSIVGDSYSILGAVSSNKMLFDFKHSGFFGINFHFTKNTNDFYLGFQPGLSYAKLNPSENSLTETTAGINPLISATVGYNFFINKLFHLFIQTRIVTGQHNYDVNKDLTEFYFSAGLGFNFNAIKTVQTLKKINAK